MSGETPLAGVWEGGIRLDVPGFSGSPADYMSVVLDDRSLRFFDFEHFSQYVHFDAGDPLGAVRPGNSFSSGELRLVGATRTDSSFSVRYRLITAPGSQASDIEESLEGTLRDERLALSYSIAGKLRGSPIQGRGSGVLTKRGSQPPLPTVLAGAIWTGEVEVEAASLGPPGRDRLMLGFGDDGRLDFVGLSNFHGGHRQEFGQPPDKFPLSGQATVVPLYTFMDWDVSVESAQRAPGSFQLSMRVRGWGKDYVETISGELGAQGLEARFTLRGLWSSTAPNLDARASGRLRPYAPPG